MASLTYLLQSPSDTRLCKTSVVFSLKEGPGQLFKACSVFALRGLDMSKIESRPMRSTTAGADGVSQPSGGFRSAHIPEEMMKHDCMLTPDSGVSIPFLDFYLSQACDFVYQLQVFEVMKCHELRKPLEILERAA